MKPFPLLVLALLLTTPALANEYLMAVGDDVQDVVDGANLAAVMAAQGYRFSSVSEVEEYDAFIVLVQDGEFFVHGDEEAAIDALREYAGDQGFRFSLVEEDELRSLLTFEPEPLEPVDSVAAPPPGVEVVPDEVIQLPAEPEEEPVEQAPGEPAEEPAEEAVERADEPVEQADEPAEEPAAHEPVEPAEEPNIFVRIVRWFTDWF